MEPPDRGAAALPAPRRWGDLAIGVWRPCTRTSDGMSERGAAAAGASDTCARGAPPPLLGCGRGGCGAVRGHRKIWCFWTGWLLCARVKVRLLTLSLGSAALFWPTGILWSGPGAGLARAADGPGDGKGEPGATVQPGEGRVPIDARDDRVQRRAIRGAALDASRESQELRELRLFEQESFPKSGLRESMGIGGREPGVVPGQRGGLGAGLGPDAVPEGLRSALGPRGEPGTSPGDAAPASTSVPWLSALKLLDNLGLAPTFVRFEAHVIKYLEFYKDERRGRSIMGSWLRKQGRYKSLIEQALDKYGLPRFLLYVAMIESGFDPHDRSHKGAVGLWQFMPEGARIYGLRVDYWVDERQDPVRSTEAAARYLGDLKARFGSWHLALAAFNAGYGAVLRAMQKYNTNDYWELCRHEDGLPWETLLYVPKAIATALVGENKAFFGYEELSADPPVSFDAVPVTASVSLAAAAKAIGVPPDDLQRLNPHLRRGRTPPLKPGETWELRLPAGTAQRFAQSPESRPESGERLVAHVVRFGERLEDLAKQRGVSASQLRRINGIAAGDDAAEIRTGVTLLVPAGRGEAAAAQNPAAAGPLTVDEIVVVAVPDKDMVVPGKRRVFYRVVPGDSIWAIARFFKVREADLLRWNNLDPEATLATKMVLDIWVDKDFDTASAVLVDPARVRVVTTGSDEFFELVEALRGRRRHKIVCQSGESWEKLAKRYGLTVPDLERINRTGRGTELKPGQTVIVYQNLSPGERAQALHKLLPGVHVPGAPSDARGSGPGGGHGDGHGEGRTDGPEARAGRDPGSTGEAGDPSAHKPARDKDAADGEDGAARPLAAPPPPSQDEPADEKAHAADAAGGAAGSEAAASAPETAARRSEPTSGSARPAAPRTGQPYGPPRPWRSPTGPSLAGPPSAGPPASAAPDAEPAKPPPARPKPKAPASKDGDGDTSSRRDRDVEAGPPAPLPPPPPLPPETDGT